MKPAAAMRMRKAIAVPNYYNDFNNAGTLADFTAYATGAGTTWGISGGALSASGGSANQCFLLNDTVPFANGYVEATMTSADQAGIVIRGSNVNNMYFLAIRDGSSIGTPNQFEIYKIVGGTYTNISGAQSVSWTRGIAKRFGLKINGSAIDVYVDGAVVYSTTDGAVTGSARAGVYCYGALINGFSDFTIQL